MGRKRAARSPKPRYKVTNWRAYNAALVKRGSVTLWLDEAMIAEWHKVSGKGAVYSDAAIICALSLRAVFGLTLRQTQGFLQSLAQLLELKLRVPHYATLSRRAEGLTVPPAPRLRPDAPIHLAIDATGLKVFGEGEWKVRIHGKSRRRVWRKLHLGVDAGTGEVHADELTLSDCDDGAVMDDLLDQVEGKIEAGYGDKAYDSFKCHRMLVDRGARPVILPRRGAAIRPPPRLRQASTTRGDIVRRMHQIGRKGWKAESRYHRRSLAETAIFRYKTIIGPKLNSRKLQTQKTEAAIGVHALNRFTALGMPITIAVR